MCIIVCIKNNTTKKEFKKHLFNLIFKKAKNNEEAKNYKYVQIPNSEIFIEYCAFSGCESLTSIIIPNSVTSIGEYAFENCTSLTTIIIPKSVTTINYAAFKNCRSLTSITIPKKFENEMESIFTYLDLSNVKVTYTL